MIKSSKILIYIICFLCFSVLGKTSEIKSISINPLNRAVIIFDFIPSELNSQLSEDKTNIMINTGKYIYRDNQRQTSGMGVISDIYLKNEKGSTVINIKTREKRGYTISSFPFTNKIYVDVFQWDRISSEEESFRTGLLAFEDKIYDEALKSFYNSAKKGYTDAAFHLGLSYLMTSNFVNAEKTLKYAYDRDSSNLDAVAGLAIAFEKTGNIEQSDIYSKLYREKAGLELNKNLNFSEFILDSTYSNIAFLDIKPINIKDTVNTDSINKHNAEITKLSQKPKKQESNNDFLSRAGDYFKYFFVIIGGTFIALIFYYFKWRKNQIELIKQKNAAKFSENLKTAGAVYNPKTIAGIYKSTELEKEIKPPPPVSVPRDDYTEKNNLMDEDKFNKLGTLIQSITGKSSESYKDSFQTPNVSAKLQLAMHLEDEQRKIKTQNLENLQFSSIPTDKNKLAEISKKLGIEKGGLETKAALEKILKDKDKLKKLSDKFGN